AEHIMLVDLARNDVGRVSGFGTVRVSELREIERYSHVMHIVSNVTGHLRTGCTGFDLVKATFPAGTVSGAPKIRAMQIISELERTRRGCYAGAIGYFGFDGNVDSCIALRCAVLKNGKAYFQSGAGIVADSSPHSEYEETVNKARAMRKALAMATRITPSRRGECGCNASDIGDFKLRELTLRLMRGENLSRAEAGNFLDCLLNPVATDAQIAAALTSLAVKGESFDELAGIAEAMRNRAVPLRSRHARFIDTAGTGSSVADRRRELGVHTTFNMLGPLTNPAQAPFQIVGVWHRSLLERVASALARLGVKKAWVVHGADGLDEITIADKTYVAACSSTGEV